MMHSSSTGVTRTQRRPRTSTSRPRTSQRSRRCATTTAEQTTEQTWKIKYLYDGACPVCRALKKTLEERKGSEQIAFVDISSPRYDPAENADVTFDDAMATIHVVEREGNAITTGLDALQKLFDVVGLGWAFKLAQIPPFGAIAALLYKLVSKNRNALGSSGEALGSLLAVGRASLELRGEKATCAEDEECRDVSAMDDIAPSSEEGPSKSAEVEITRSTSEDGDMQQGNGAPEQQLGSRPEVLAAYTQSSGVLRGAIVDTRTGELRGSVEEVAMDDEGRECLDLNVYANGLRTLVQETKWPGDIAIALPGLLGRGEAMREAPGAPPVDLGARTTFRELESTESASPLVQRRERAETEEWLRRAVGRDVVVLTSAEAHAYGHAEEAYERSMERLCQPEREASSEQENRGEIDDVSVSSSIRTEKRIRSPLCVTVTATTEAIHVAIFRDGVTMRTADLRGASLGFWNLPVWSSSPRPSKDTPAEDDAWKRWAERVQHYLERIDATLLEQGFLVDEYMIAGSATETFKLWAKHIPKSALSAPLLEGPSPRYEGLRGTGIGGGFQYRYRDDVALVRSAIGEALGEAPQLVPIDELRGLFDRFCDEGESDMGLEEFVRLVRALGVRMPDDEIRELVSDVDSMCLDRVTFDEFQQWWLTVIGQAAEVLHTEDAFDQVIREESTGNRVVILMVGFTTCKPCKKFLPFFEKWAADNERVARCVRVYANENGSTVHLARDRLKIRSTPTFFIFKDGDRIVHTHTGISEEKFADGVDEALGLIPEGSYAEKWQAPTSTIG
ncbi:thioredoxin [Pycnococcus provasolii]